MKAFRSVFRRLPDPRAGNARHDLCEVLFIALAATLCGAESCAEMAEFGQSKEGFLRLLLRLEHGIPSHDTFSRVFRLLEPRAFEKGFRRFIAGFAKANKLNLTGVVAVDEGFARGFRSRPAEHTVAHGQRLGGRGADLPGAAQGPRSQRVRGCAGSAGAAGPRRLHRDR